MRRMLAGLPVLLAWSFGVPTSAEPGFGGSMPDEHGAETGAPARGAECLVPDATGAWVSCDAWLSPHLPAADEENEPSASIDIPGGRPRGAPVRDGLEAAEQPFTPTIKPLDTPTRRLSPLEAVLEANRRDLPVPPLVTLRDSVRLLEERIAEHDSDPARASEVEGWARELRLANDVLAHVEQKAKQRMEDCLRRHGMPIAQPSTGYRMTPAGPVPLTLQEREAEAKKADPYPCERVRVVDAALIELVQQYYRTRRQLREGDFGWENRDQEATLRRELEALRQAIDPEDPLRDYRPGIHR